MLTYFTGVHFNIFLLTSAWIFMWPGYFSPRKVKFSLSTLWRHTGRSRGMVPLFLNLGARWRWVVSITRRRYGTLVPTEFEVGLAPEPVWTILRWQKSLVLTGIRTSHRRSHGLVTLPTVQQGFWHCTNTIWVFVFPPCKLHVYCYKM